MASTAMAATAEERTASYAQERLEEWGQWLRDLRGVRLGYSSHAPFVIERVDNDHEAAALMDDSANERAEEIEQIMCRLAQMGPALHRALVNCYLLRRNQMEAAAECHCSVRIYRARLRTGEIWIAARLLG